MPKKNKSVGPSEEFMKAFGTKTNKKKILTKKK